jgi:hypothetical protein
MRRFFLYIATAITTLTIGATATLGLDVASDRIVSVIPVDDAPCWEETPRVMIMPTNGGAPYCVGGEKRKFPNCP